MSSVPMLKPRISPLILPIHMEDLDVAGTVKVKAMVRSAVHLRIWPKDRRPTFPVQVNNARHEIASMLAAGYHRVVKAVVDGDEGRVLGFAGWILFHEKKAQVPPGFVPLTPVERTMAEEEEAYKGLDFALREQAGAISTKYLSLMVVDPEYQSQGIGRALLQWGLDQADSHSPALEVYLESSEDGRRLYEKGGFKLAGWNIVKDDEHAEGDLKWLGMKRDARDPESDEGTAPV
ncbi:acyl-CoA N-acyltransferase [Mycena rebaudengoi]|nr:acyl-CoA N-acyltransferase [Mycena rebaudengoi]